MTFWWFYLLQIYVVKCVRNCWQGVLKLLLFVLRVSFDNGLRSCIIRFQEAEDDCTEALNLDDRYVKAYSCRATARKELGKLKESIEDSEFALRLEPHNQEIKKQYAEAKSLYEKRFQKNSVGHHHNGKLLPLLYHKPSTSHPEARGDQNKVMENWDDIVILCGKDRATGEGAENCNDAIETMAGEGEYEVTS